MHKFNLYGRSKLQSIILFVSNQLHWLPPFVLRHYLPMLFPSEVTRKLLFNIRCVCGCCKPALLHSIYPCSVELQVVLKDKLLRKNTNNEIVKWLESDLLIWKRVQNHHWIPIRGDPVPSTQWNQKISVRILRLYTLNTLLPTVNILYVCNSFPQKS